MNVKAIVCTILCCNITAFCAQPAKANTVNSYKGQIITSQSVLGLMPALPTITAAALLSWTKEHYAVLKRISTIQHPVCGPQGSFKELQQEHLTALKSDGLLKSSGRYNFMIQVDLPTGQNDIPTRLYNIRMAGPINRVCSLIVYNQGCTPSPTPIKDTAQLEDTIQQIVPTYQTVSRAAHYLRMVEFLERTGIKNVITPSAWLVPFEAIKPGEEATDDNTFVVQERFADVVKVKDLSAEEKSKFTPEGIRNLLRAICYVGLWDIMGHLKVKKGTTDFVIGGLQQPNNSNPRFFYLKDGEFFGKNRPKAINNVMCGIGQLAQLFITNEPCLQVCQEFAQKTDQEVLALMTI